MAHSQFALEKHLPTVKVDLDTKTGSTANFTLNASRNKPQKDIFVNITTQAGTLDTKTPSVSFPVTATGAPPSASQSNSRSKR